MKKTLALLLALQIAVLTVVVFTACQKPVNLEKQAYLNQQLEGTGFSGVVLMTENGAPICEAAQGIENPKSQDPITTDTLFCIGSVSKQFAAGTIMLLQQEGKLSIDDPLTKYYPQYTAGKNLTLRHLLEMRSGIVEFYDVEYIDDAFTELPTGELRDVVTNKKSAEENRQTLENWLLRQPLQFEPDTEYEYCNSNYFLLARIVEKVSGQSYCEFVRTRIFQPLGMTHSYFIDEVDFKTLPHLAAPTVRPQTVCVGVTMGLGDMISNAYDIDRWLTSLRTNDLLTKESVAMMSTDYSDGDEANYGFGLCLGPYGVYHSGSITTYKAMTYTNPEAGINVFTVTNDEPNPDTDITDIGSKLISMSDELYNDA